MTNRYRVDRTSNPFRGSPTDWTTTDYDALGRVIKITHPDGSMATTSYSANVTTVIDEAGKDRQTTTDALGRLTQVIEDPGAGGLAYATNYAYDDLGNLTRVTQGSQIRTFGYDSLSRLLCASNPESRIGNPLCDASPLPTTGVDRFAYDDNGNLLTKTDARGITITTGYDGKNRPLQTTYTDATPPVTFCYDGTDFNGSTCTGGQVTGKKARLTAVGSSVSTMRFPSFDDAGRILASSQQTGGFQYNFAYTYNKAGGLETQQYPSGFTAKTCYDDAGRIDALSNAGTSAPYVSSPAYAPHGAIAQLTLGNGLVESTNFNNRLQPTQIGLGTTAGGTQKLKLEFTYGGSNNNGNILTQKITPPGIAAITQTYNYDPLNRLLTAAESSAGNPWSRSYTYDQYGNRAVTANSGLPTSPLMPGSLSDYVAATNRFVSGPGAFDNDYDEAGNQERNKLGELLAYDANNRQTSYTTGSATTTYHYDAGGNRVKKVTPTKTDIYVYDAFGKLAAEYSTVATTAPAGAHYRTVDHLGSTRLVTLQNQTEHARYDFLPFGEEIAVASGNPRFGIAGYGSNLDDRQKFTGKERDDESGMDYFLARYYSGLMGRFLSVDPKAGSGRLPDPQTWNRYAYARDNPIRFVDPDGQDFLDVVDGFFNAAASNAAFGVGRRDPSTAIGSGRDFRIGQAVGDAGSVAAGLFNINAGGTAAAGGAALSLTGGGAVVGAPAVVAGATAVGIGSSQVALGFGNLLAAAKNTEPTDTEGSTQDKRLTKGDIEELKKAGVDPEKLKADTLGTNKGISRFDLFKDKRGEIFVKPKSGDGPGEPTGQNIKKMREE
ncbi:MAG: polymorphic toxin type 33 domain-containing protein [Acidobacteria bacterium]|nr:polymorphic toxin type 33 domain-containing protein [Acidobacteriota bacterium]